MAQSAPCPGDRDVSPSHTQLRRPARDRGRRPAAFPHDHADLRLRDALGPIDTDIQFAGLFARVGQPAACPWRLALITLLQFSENLSDRRAADAVRARIDWRLYGGSSHEIALVEGFVVTNEGVGQSDEATSHCDDG